jgi:hypothetical protein
MPSRKRLCKICFKLYDQSVYWQVESHTHQGQGPTDSKIGGRD